MLKTITNQTLNKQGPLSSNGHNFIFFINVYGHFNLTL